MEDIERVGKFSVRRALPGDEKEIAKVHIQAWQESYKELVPQDYLDQLSKKLNERILQWEKTISNPRRWAWVAEDSSEIVGFVLFGEPRDSSHSNPSSSSRDDSTVELGAIYLLEKSKRKGIGIALVSAGFGFLKGLGYGQCYCWVLAQNPSIGFYERCGARFFGRTQWDEIGGVQFEEKAYEWNSLELEFSARSLKPI